MKKMNVATQIFMFLTVSIVLLKTNPAAAGTYTVSQLDTEMVSDDLYPTINNQGQIVWFHAGCQFQTGDPEYTYTETGKYYFYQGGSLTELKIHKNYDYPLNYFHPPHLLFNDSGQTGYEIQDYNDGGKYKIYFHDGPDSSPQLVSSSLSIKSDVQLNQSGRMVWDTYDADTILQVYLFNNGQTNPLTVYSDASGYTGFSGGLSLNDQGEVLWTDRTYDDANNLVQNIQLYKEGVTRCLYSSMNTMFFTQINNQGRVVWVEQDAVTGLSDIMLYDGAIAKHIPGGDGFLWGYVVYPQINNSGQVMWLGKKTDDNDEYNIYLYSNDSTTQVTHYTNDGTYVGIIDLYENYSDAKTSFAPHLNNNGEIVWVTKVPNSAKPAYLDLAVQVYSGGQITQLDRWTVDPHITANWGDAALHAVYVQINDAGQVAWSRYNGADVPNRSSDFEIYLATPIEPLANAIKSLQVLTGLMNAPGAGDVTRDKKIGLQDIIYSLQSKAGLRH